MSEQYSVLLSALVREHKLTVVNKSSDYESAEVFSMAVARPGLLFAGFYEYYDPQRVLVYGKQEHTYLELLSPEARRASVEGLMRLRPCVLIACHDVGTLPEVVEYAAKHDVTLLSSPRDTSEFMARLIASLHIHLAPRKTIHAVLVEVYGEGVLITGDSGIGKSETALELIKRGHRLIADDAVEIRRISGDVLVGQAPPLIRHYMEFRGIGIINARNIYGMGAVKTNQSIHLAINLENWEDYKPYVRLGSDEEYTDILDVPVPSVTVPVRPGRNLAVIIELAAMNNRQKKLGYNAARDLEQRHDAVVDGLFEPEWY